MYRMEELINEWPEEIKSKKGDDQVFLEQKIWPIVVARHEVLAHDSDITRPFCQEVKCLKFSYFTHTGSLQTVPFYGKGYICRKSNTIIPDIWMYM